MKLKAVSIAAAARVHADRTGTPAPLAIHDPRLRECSSTDKTSSQLHSNAARRGVKDGALSAHQTLPSSYEMVTG